MDCLASSTGWLIKAGRILTQYQRQLSHGDMTAIYNSGRLSWGQRYCQVLPSMARNPALSDPKLLQMLPSSIAALEVIAMLLDAELIQKDRPAVPTSISPICAIFDTNGSFRIDDVLPGTYTLSINIGDPAVPSSPFDSKLLGSLEQEVTVPETEGAPDEPPIDLGTLDLQPALKETREN